jgi:hypothetical protein
MASRNYILSASLIAALSSIIWYNNNSSSKDRHTTLTTLTNTYQVPNNVQPPPVKKAFYVSPSEPNGDCLFISIAVSEQHATTGIIPLYGSNQRAKQAHSLRLQANDILCRKDVDGIVRPTNKALTKDGLPCSLLIEPLHYENGEQYCQRLRSNGEWGSAGEIMALSYSLKKPITVHVHQKNKNGKATFPVLQKFGIDESPSSEKKQEDPNTIHIVYTSNNHYDALLFDSRRIPIPIQQEHSRL